MSANVVHTPTRFLTEYIGDSKPEAYAHFIANLEHYSIGFISGTHSCPDLVVKIAFGRYLALQIKHFSSRSQLVTRHFLFRAAGLTRARAGAA